MKKLCQAPLTTSAQALYAAPANNSQTTVEDIEICNTTAGALTCNVHIGSGSASTSNAILYGTPVPANTTMQWTGSVAMNPGDIIQALGSAAGLTITVSGDILQST